MSGKPGWSCTLNYAGRVVWLWRPVGGLAKLVKARSICLLVFLLLLPRETKQSTSSVQRNSADYLLEQIRSIRRAWTKGMLRLVWLGWQLVAIRYWCVSVGVTYRSVVMLPALSKWKWKCVIFKSYSSEELITLNTLHEVIPTWYSFHSWVDWNNADKVSCSRRKHIDDEVRTRDLCIQNRHSNHYTKKVRHPKTELIP